MNYGQMKSNAKSLTTSAAKAANTYSDIFGTISTIKGIQSGKTGADRIKGALQLLSKFNG